MTLDRHTVSYEVLNRRETIHHPPEFEVHATPEELMRFAESGYLVREQLFQDEALARLQDALARLEAAEWDRTAKTRPKTAPGALSCVT